jgi:hypothetical protein
MVISTKAVTGDGDGDGTIGDSGDVTIRDNQSGKMLPLLIGPAPDLLWRRHQVDFDDDGDVGDDDVAVVGDNAGMTGADWEDGDLDGNGEVNEDDRDLAFAQFRIWNMPRFNFSVVS